MGRFLIVSTSVRESMIWMCHNFICLLELYHKRYLLPLSRACWPDHYSWWSYVYISQTSYYRECNWTRAPAGLWNPLCQGQVSRGLFHAKDCVQQSYKAAIPGRYEISCQLTLAHRFLSGFAQPYIDCMAVSDASAKPVTALGSY